METEVHSLKAPTESTVALIERRIVTIDEVHQQDTPDALSRLIEARTDCNWSAHSKEVVVQIVNPSDRQVYLKKRPRS